MHLEMNHYSADDFEIKMSKYLKNIIFFFVLCFADSILNIYELVPFISSMQMYICVTADIKQRCFYRTDNSLCSLRGSTDEYSVCSFSFVLFKFAARPETENILGIRKRITGIVLYCVCMSRNR